MKEIVELGDRVEDLVTGFSGIVSSYAICLNGCDRVGVQPPIDKEKKHPDSIWFDVTQLKILKKKVVKPQRSVLELFLKKEGFVGIRREKKEELPGGPPSRRMP